MSERKMKRLGGGAAAVAPNNANDEFLLGDSKVLNKNINEEFMADDKDIVYIHNLSGGEFHVPPSSVDPKVIQTEEILVFQLNECLPISKDAVKSNKNLLKCIQMGRLEVFTPEQYKEWKKIQDRSDRENKKNAVQKGVYEPSGLPADWKLAVRMVMEMDDLDQLESLLDTDDRTPVQNAIESQIDSLEGLTAN